MINHKMGYCKVYQNYRKHAVLFSSQLLISVLDKLFRILTIHSKAMAVIYLILGYFVTFSLAQVAATTNSK